MKPCLTLFAVIILITNSFAQTSSSEPLQLNKNFLVHSAGLPEEFLLFSPDSATQVLFNPARAYNYSTNFIYVNYLSDHADSYRYYLEEYMTNVISFNWVPSGFELQPKMLAKGNAFNFPSLYEERYSSSKNSTFSAAALINAGDAKWLFTLANGIDLREDEYNSVYNEERIFDPVNDYHTDYGEGKSNNTSDEMITTLKIARIWKSGSTNLSLGTFGIIYTDDDNGKGDFVSESYDFFNSTTDSTKIREFSYRTGTEKGEFNNSKFAFGLEFAVNDARWDYIGSISYQKANNSGNLNRNLYSLEFDSTYYAYPWSTSRFEESRTTDNKLVSEPYFLNLTNYFQHSVDWITPDDNLFFTLNSFYSTGDISYSAEYNRYFMNYYNGTLTSSDTNSVIQNGGTDAKSWRVILSSGYALSASLSDLFILTGIRLAGSLGSLEYVNANLFSQSGSAFTENTLKNTFAGLTFPLYLNYTMAEWISLYGGINYSYFYNRYNYESKTAAIDYSSYPSNTEVTGKNEVVFSEWNSSKSIYLGCEFRHSSGFKVQFFFDEDFSNIRDFNVSVGYHF